MQWRVPVEGTPFDTARDYTDGPAAWGNIYGFLRQFHVVGRPAGPGVVWQDRATGVPQVTWLSDTDPGEHSTSPLPSIDGTVMAAAGSDEEGDIFLLLIQEGSGVPNDPRDAWLVRCGPDGVESLRRPLDTGPEGLNMVTFGTRQATSNQAALKWSDGVLAIMLARQMTQSGDGLNHQGGIALSYDAQTLERTGHMGQTSGHSFGNVLSVEGPGAFLGLDLGDNYPRGVHVHRIVEGGISSRVVYTFKTAHGRSPTSPAGAEYNRYDEISDDETSYYKWSNDNATYTELGGVVKTEGGMTVVFATERSGLDNSRVGETLNDPRDVALVQVRSDLANASRGEGANVVTDDLVLSQGEAPEEGGFYDFGGGWQPQRNAGVVWLTDHPGLGHNASRIKVHPVAGDDDERLLVLWELWTPDSHRDTLATLVDPSGAQRLPGTSLGQGVRLGRRDDPFTLAGGVATVAGSGADSNELIVTVVFP